MLYEKIIEIHSEMDRHMQIRPDALYFEGISKLRYNHFLNLFRSIHTRLPAKPSTTRGS